MATTLPPEATDADTTAKDQHLAKVKRFRGDSYPEMGAGPERILPFLRECMRKTEPDAQARFRQTMQNMLYAYGKQHLTWNKKARMWEEVPTLGEQDFRVTMNYIRPILRARTQRLLGSPVQFAANAKGSSFEARDRAVLGATVVQSRYDQTHMDEKLDQGFELAFASGASFLKGIWNTDLGPITPAKHKVIRMEPVTGDDGQPMLGPDGQPVQEPVIGDDGKIVFDEVYIDRDGRPVEDRAQAYQYRPGDTDTRVRSVFNVRLNPDCVAFDPGAGLRWVLDTDTLPLEEAKELFPEFAEKIDATAGDDGLAITLERMAAGAAVLGALRTAGQPQQGAPNKQAGKTTVIQEYWELPSDCYPDGRLIVRCGNVIVYDDVFPHGVLPYTPLFDEPAPLTPLGRPCINDMRSPQDLINRQWTAIDAEARLNSIGRYVSWEHPNVPDQIVADDRTVIKIPMTQRLMGKSLKDMFYRLEPGTLGGERWRMIQEAKSALNDIGGFHEVSRGQVPPGVDSGVAIEKLREEENGQLAKSRHALKKTLLKWGEIQLTIANREYGEDVTRYVPADRDDMGYVLEQVDGTRLPDPADIALELEGFKAQSAAGLRAEVKEAIDKKWIDPRKGLKLLDLGKGLAPILDSQTRHYNRARWLNLAIEKGEFMVKPTEITTPDGETMEVGTMMHPDGTTPFVLPDDDDHAIHLMVLDELVLDEQKPWPTRQAAMLLKAERRRTVELQQADVAQPQAEPGAAA